MPFTVIIGPELGLEFGLELGLGVKLVTADNYLHPGGKFPVPQAGLTLRPLKRDTEGLARGRTGTTRASR